MAPASIGVELDSIAIELLHKSGWHQNRRVDVSEELGVLRKSGIEPWKELEIFLESYSGLSMTYVRRGRVDELWIDPNRACQRVDSGFASAYAARVGTEVAPVGGMDFDHATLYMARDGRFFGGFDDVLWYLGSSPVEAITAVIADSGTNVD